MKILCAFLFLSPLMLASCQREQAASVVREELFALDIGRLEDQIDLYHLTGSRSVRKTAIDMRDGFLYVSNGNGGKISRYTSYGDLLFMIYNEETNPPPISLRLINENDRLLTRWAVSYPLAEPGEIAVDSRKHIYAEDRFPPERHSFDAEQRMLLDSMVLHFDGDGRFVEYLGQEGAGGTPFPRINGVYASYQDEVAVVCRLPQGWKVYWFDAAGTALYTIALDDEHIPLPPGIPDVFFSVDAVVAAPDERKLYIKVDYYRNLYDESTGSSAGSEPAVSIVWLMNTEDGSYAGSIEVPFYEYTYIENKRRITERLLYSMLGVSQGGRVFLSIPAEGGYSLLILPAKNPESGQRRGFIAAATEELKFNRFSLSDEGILTGLLATDWEARLVWWRTDRLAGELAP
jgi:hypothetical protein